jgi:hypothetical protein
MRKLLLAATLVLVSATAQAGTTRSLTTVASSDGPAVAERAKAAKLSARQRPSMQQQSSQRLQQQNALAAQHGHSPGMGMVLKAKGRSVLARIKFALHHRGVYW